MKIRQTDDMNSDTVHWTEFIYVESHSWDSVWVCVGVSGNYKNFPMIQFIVYCKYWVSIVSTYLNLLFHSMLQSSSHLRGFLNSPDCYRVSDILAFFFNSVYFRQCFLPVCYVQSSHTAVFVFLKKTRHAPKYTALQFTAGQLILMTSWKLSAVLFLCQAQ